MIADRNAGRRADPSPPASTSGVRPKRKFSAAARNRMSQAQKRRYAAQRKQSGAALRTKNITVGRSIGTLPETAPPL